MRQAFRFSVAVSIAVILSLSTADVARADSFRDYCHQRAQDLSGYRGGRGGDVVGGAVKGAIGAAIIAGILGGDKRDRKRAARAGAIIGGIKGARRPNSRAARIYRLELEACLRQR